MKLESRPEISLGGALRPLLLQQVIIKVSFLPLLFQVYIPYYTIILHWSSIQGGLLWKNRYYVTDLLCNGSKNQMKRKVFAWNRNWPKKNGILLPKLFWPTVRKKCSSDWEKLLIFEAEGREFAKFLRSLEQFIQTVKGQNNFW